MILPHSTTLANLVGLALYPLAYWQFAWTKTRKDFLLANFTTCLVFSLSFELTGLYMASIISILAAISTITQRISMRSTYRWTITLVSALSALIVAPPVDLFSWLPLLSFIWNRTAESMDHLTTRVMFISSPVIWMIVSWHGGNYTLIPVDALSFFLSMRWVVDRLRQCTECYYRPEEVTIRNE